jgi:hypothetical protein
MASDPELVAGEQPEPSDDDDDVEETDPTGRYFRVCVPPPPEFAANVFSCRVGFSIDRRAAGAAPVLVRDRLDWIADVRLFAFAR